jgi:hypothetical protein
MLQSSVPAFLLHKYLIRHRLEQALIAFEPIMARIVDAKVIYDHWLDITLFAMSMLKAPLPPAGDKFHVNNVLS